MRQTPDERTYRQSFLQNHLSSLTSPYTRQHQSCTGGQGRLCRLDSVSAKISTAWRTDGWTKRRTDGPTERPESSVVPGPRISGPEPTLPIELTFLLSPHRTSRRLLLLLLARGHIPWRTSRRSPLPPCHLRRSLLKPEPPIGQSVLRIVQWRFCVSSGSRSRRWNERLGQKRPPPLSLDFRLLVGVLFLLRFHDDDVVEKRSFFNGIVRRRRRRRRKEKKKKMYHWKVKDREISRINGRRKRNYGIIVSMPTV